MGWGFYAPYVPIAQRRMNAARKVQRLARKGQPVLPVQVPGRVIASTFWGKSWCDNLESYSDFSNRLPRGRTYVRNGSVVDLQIEPGKITSMVSGSHLYYPDSTCGRTTLEETQRAVRHSDRHSGGTLAGTAFDQRHVRRDKSRMRSVPRARGDRDVLLLPGLGGHVQARRCQLYGVGNRLDREPQLLFKLRQVDHLELIAQAGQSAPQSKSKGRKTIARDQLAEVFGIELETECGAGGTQRKSAKSLRSKKAAALEKTKTARADAGSPPERASAVSGKPAGSRRKTLTAAERIRIAEAQVKRWRDARDRMRSPDRSENQGSPGPVKKSAKAKLAPSAQGKPERRSRAV